MKTEKHHNKLYKLILFGIVFLATFILFQGTNKVSGYFSDYATAEVTMTIKNKNSTSNPNSLAKSKNNISTLLSGAKDTIEVNNTLPINNFFEKSKIAEKQSEAESKVESTNNTSNEQNQELANEADETLNTEPIPVTSDDSNIKSDDSNSEIEAESFEEQKAESDEKDSDNLTDLETTTDTTVDSEDAAKKELDNLIKSLSDEEKEDFMYIQDILLEKYNIDLTDYLDLIENIIYHTPIKDDKTPINKRIENFFSILLTNNLYANKML